METQPPLWKTSRVLKLAPKRFPLVFLFNLTPSTLVPSSPIPAARLQSSTAWHFWLDLGIEISRCFAGEHDFSIWRRLKRFNARFIHRTIRRRGWRACPSITILGLYILFHDTTYRRRHITISSTVKS